jgi:5S rRNA maturation endonuclease (ribonuclease M5)
MLLLNLDFPTCLQRINVDLNLKLGTSNALPIGEITKQIYIPKGENNGIPRLIQFKPQHYTEADLAYWAQYGIPKWQLELYNVFSAKYVFLDHKLLLRATLRDPIYCYKFPKTKRVKVYRPLVKNKAHIKWLSNVTSDDLQGEEQLIEGDRLIITKSMKDVMVLGMLNFPAIAPQAEGTRNQYDKILEIANQFQQVTILFDYDPTGIKGAEDLQNYLRNAGISVQVVYIKEEGIKDISDFVAVRGTYTTERFLKTLINETKTA